MESGEYLSEYFESIKYPVSDEKDVAFLNSENDDDCQYVHKVVDGVLEKKDEFDKIISENLRGWEQNRISKVSVAVLRLALFEMLYLSDVPMKVAINEAVEIAKRYDGQECAAFVNGVLASAASKLGIEG